LHHLLFFALFFFWTCLNFQKMSKQEPQTAADILTHYSCSDLLQQRQLLLTSSISPPEHPICLDSELSVSDACAALAKHKISSAPVYQALQGGFLGLFDYHDVVTYVLAVLHKVEHDSPHQFDAELVI
jgi:CBS domain containing-hemolysin-like protein